METLFNRDATVFERNNMFTHKTITNIMLDMDVWVKKLDTEKPIIPILQERIDFWHRVLELLLITPSSGILEDPALFSSFQAKDAPVGWSWIAFPNRPFANRVFVTKKPDMDESWDHAVSIGDITMPQPVYVQTPATAVPPAIPEVLITLLQMITMIATALPEDAGEDCEFVTVKVPRVSWDLIVLAAKEHYPVDEA